MKLLRIELLLAEQGLADPRADDMRGDERGDAQAEHKLQRFDRLPAELPALVQRPEPETRVHQRRGIEDDPNGWELPEQGVVFDALGHRLQRDVAERMVEEVADQVGEQHQPAGKADLPQADTADKLCQFLPRAGGDAIHESKTQPRGRLFRQ